MARPRYVFYVLSIWYLVSSYDPTLALHPSKYIVFIFIWYLLFACFVSVVIKHQKGLDCKENGSNVPTSLDFGV
jgi:hypothetical protein